MRVIIQTHDFDITDEHQRLSLSAQTGAIVTFVGTVRDFTTAQNTGCFELEHYQGMTEKSLSQIATDANTHFDLHDLTIIHRIGKLNVNDHIVFVGCASAHRRQAFLACEYMMDRLKTEAPFWKKEGEKWVDASEQDTTARARWIEYGLK